MIKSFVNCSITLLFIIVCSFSAGIADLPDDISNLIKAGNTREIARFFSPTVNTTILTDENIFSKIQAEAVLKDFFSKHTPLSVKPLHKLSSNPNYKFTVLLLHTNNGDFRVSFSLKNINSEFLLTEVRIEANKE